MTVYLLWHRGSVLGVYATAHAAEAQRAMIRESRVEARQVGR